MKRDSQQIFSKILTTPIASALQNLPAGRKVLRAKLQRPQALPQQST
jgi:hypothetical protein